MLAPAIKSLALVLALPAAAQNLNLVKNGGFEDSATSIAPWILQGPAIQAKLQQADMAGLGSSQALAFTVPAVGPAYVYQEIQLKKDFVYRVSYDALGLESPLATLMLHTRLYNAPNSYFHARLSRPTRFQFSLRAPVDTKALVQVGIANNGRVMLDNIEVVELPPASILIEQGSMGTRPYDPINSNTPVLWATWLLLPRNEDTPTFLLGSAKSAAIQIPGITGRLLLDPGTTLLFHSHVNFKAGVTTFEFSVKGPRMFTDVPLFLQLVEWPYFGVPALDDMNWYYGFPD